MRRIISFVILLASGSWSLLAEAGLVTLDFSSLPSAQGWTYYTTTTGSHAGTTEGSVFSVSANTLTGNTMADGLVSPSSLGYRQDGIVDPDLPWTLSWTMRLLNYENGSPGYNDFGAWLSVYNGESAVGVGLSGVGTDNPQSGITASGTSHTALDTSFFRDYRIEFTPDTASGSWRLFVDNAELMSGVGAVSSTQSQLAFGDGTGGANAHWEMTAYAFSQPVAGVPAPATLYLIIPGLIGLFRLYRIL